ncbi:MAG: hypothetical protein NAOJABEB_03078 [Steroidobacteraceae bacterium]|nr:hypothetical protein [Steroidobacteraceae bacterium]
MATPALRRPRGAGTCRQGAVERAGGQPRPSCVPVQWHARCRQDDHRADPRQVPQLRNRCDCGAVRQVRRLSRDRRGPLRRPDRGRCRLAHQGRRHARAPRERAVHARGRPLQGVPDRRSAHAVAAFVQCAAEDARRAAAPRQVPARDHRSAAASGHGAVALPAIQPETAAGRVDRRADGGDPRGRERARRSRSAHGAGARGRRQPA